MSNSNFIAIRSNDGAWKVIPTKFDRQVGDAIVVDNKKFVVVTSGDFYTCKSTMDFSVIKNIQHRKNGKIPVYPEGKFSERNLI